jgi:hypothetical protein
MAYRIFRDSHGTEWQTWDVTPSLSDRRSSERRMRVLQPPHTERRSHSERRVHAGSRPALITRFDSGWLCFEAEEEKRRLAPIPTDWPGCDVVRLEEYCAQATPVRRTPVEMRRDKRPD